MVTQSEEKMLQIASKILFGILLVSFLLTLCSEFFNNEISQWVRNHLLLGGISFLILLLASFIGLLNPSELYNYSNYNFLILCGQMSFSFNLVTIRSDYDLSRNGVLIMGLTPTIIFLLRSYFTRLHRMERMIEDIFNNNPVEKRED